MHDRSCVVLVPAHHIDSGHADAMWREFDSAHLPAENFAVPLVPASGPSDADPTHYGMHAWDTEERATIWLALPTNGGTLPPFTPNGSNTEWEDYGVTEAQARAVAASLTVSVMTGAVPSEHFAAVTGGLGLKRFD